MSILIPVVDTGITLNEVPGYVAFYIEIGNCTQKCEGCHSPNLWATVNKMTRLEDLLEKVARMKDAGADAVVLMGGTTNGISEHDLKVIINSIACFLPVALYSGRDDTEKDLELLKSTDLSWIKTGSYKKALGGLSSPGTNQRFYAKQMIIKDITEVFQCS